ncbi:MAG: hypothetical protein LC135_05895 [Phycisphaerae bacterium]|nr:hypothetical protein [Phycisphaerae bacterium]MCZ2399388.1 hypothetical protein [Phycisphaerae bacterium]
MRESTEYSGAMSIVRNLILLLSTGAVLAILFAGYWTVLQGAGRAGAGGARAHLPVAEADLPDTVMQVGAIEVPGGGAAAWTSYDERTGQPVMRFSCESYSPVPGSRNEVHCTRPQLTQRLPGGMVATVAGDEARLLVDRAGGSGLRPRSGRISGQARIIVDRAAGLDQPPLSDRPQDQVLVELDYFDFDLNIGSMRTTSAVRAVSRDFEITGAGLDFVWNQTSNRIEKLELAQGRRLVLHMQRDLASGLSETPGAPAAVSPAAAAAPAPAAAAAKRGAAGYACTLSGGVLAGHYRSRRQTKSQHTSEFVGEIEAEALRLVFDMQSSAGLLAERDPNDVRGPVDPREHLVIDWSGPLTILPDEAQRPGDGPRRRVDALGEHVVLRLPHGAITTGGLTLQQDAERLWLRPGPDGRVAARLGGLEASAGSMYFDGAQRLLKLMGPVWLRSGERRDASEIACRDWAELELQPSSGRAIGADIDGFGAVRRARFVGAVVANVDGERVRANELVAHFAEAMEAASASESAAAHQGDGLAARIETIEAGGDVLLTSGDRRLSCWWLRAALDVDGAGRRFPRHVTADGSVLLVDRQRRLWGEGRRLEAWLDDARRIDRAAISGTAEHPAKVRAEDYAVRGHEIDFDGGRKTMKVDGWSELVFRASRSLRGLPQSGATPTRVVSRESLVVDLRPERNAVQFTGEVTARNGDEELLADAVTLYLRDAPEERGPAGANSGSNMGRALHALLGQAGAAAASVARSSLAAVQAAREGGVADEPAPILGERLARKEPVRLLARNAVVQTNAYVAGDAEPILHQSLAAPEINVDIAARAIRTLGQTSLYMIDRRLDAEESSAGPSALVSRGPSQTILRSELALTYALGADGPQRLDRVILEGDVRFRRVTGEELLDVERMLPRLAQDPAVLKQLETRNTYLESERLECELRTDAAGGAGAGRSALALSWIGASGDVYLRDQRGDDVRSVETDRLEFDRMQGLVRVLGEGGRLARVYNENRRTGKLDVPVVGAELLLDLRANTVRTQRIQGTIRP